MNKTPLVSGPSSPTLFPTRWCFQKHTPNPLIERIARDLTAQQDEEPKYLVCSACKHKITTTDSKIAIDGQHHHVFTNPGGFVFEIGCFAWAESCIHHGLPTLEYTWFSGYRWCLALCAHCYTHLGWFYQNADHFYGFIVQQLEEQSR